MGSLPLRRRREAHRPLLWFFFSSFEFYPLSFKGFFRRLYSVTHQTRKHLPVPYGTFPISVNVYLKAYDTRIENRYCSSVQLFCIDEIKELWNAEFCRIKKHCNTNQSLLFSEWSEHYILNPCLIKMEWKMRTATNTGMRTEDFKIKY